MKQRKMKMMRWTIGNNYTLMIVTKVNTSCYFTPYDKYFILKSNYTHFTPTNYLLFDNAISFNTSAT